MSTYLGLDVLDLTRHNRQGTLAETLRRKFRLLDPSTGKRVSDSQGKAPAPARPFLWTCLSRPEITAMLAFLDARKGRCVPFWLPSYQQDLTLAADAASGAISLTVRWINYTVQMFPQGGGRRHLALYDPNSSPVYRKVTAATDPGGRVTESLGLDATLPRAFPAATTVVSFLKLCRLEEDRNRTNWLSRNVAEAEIMVRELPQEAPV